MGNKGHSKVGASSAHRWMACPGSVRLCAEQPPQKETNFAAEGTAAHDLAERALIYDRPTTFWLGHPLHNGHVPDEEMCTYTQTYVDAVKEEAKEAHKHLHVEVALSLDWLHPDLYGTADAVIIDPFKKLTVFDLKYGAGIPVTVENNLQQMYYALGAAHEFHFDFDEVEMVIGQPRVDHKDGTIRRWTIKAEKLREFGDVLLEAVKATEKPDAPLMSGTHCKFCAAKPVCPALKNATYELAQMEFDSIDNEVLPTPPEPESLTVEQLTKVLDSASVIRDWLNSVEGYCHTEAEHGKEIKGYKLVQKRANRKFKSEEEIVRFLMGEGFKENELYSNPKLKSPAQIEKIKGVDKSSLAEYYEKPNTGTTLVPEYDKRPAVNASVIEDFKE